MAKGPAGPPVPHDKGPGAGALVFEAVDRGVIFDEEGACLHEMAGWREGAPVLAPENAWPFFHRHDAGGERRLGVPPADVPAVFNNEPEGASFFGEEAGIDGGESPMGPGCSLRGWPLGGWAVLLVCYREPVVPRIKENKGELDSLGSDSLDTGGERVPGGRLEWEEGEGALSCSPIGEVRGRLWKFRGGKGLVPGGRSRTWGLGGATAQSEDDEQYARGGRGKAPGSW